MKNIKYNNVKRFKEFDIAKLIIFVLVALYCLSMIYFLLWGLITSFKDEWDFIVDGNIFGLPGKEYGWCFSNYKTAIELFDVQIKGALHASAYRQFLNSILYAFGCTFAAVFSKLVAAYAVAKYDFFLKKPLYFISIVTMILPIVGSMPSTINVMRMLNIYNTYYGSIIMNTGYYGLYFLLFHAAFSSVDNSYMEAARIDGAGHFTIMFKIMFPLIETTILAISIMVFINYWNNYTEPMIYLQSMPTISYGLYLFSRSSKAANAPALLSGAFIVCIPMIILFIIFRNKLMLNVAVGGVKG